MARTVDPYYALEFAERRRQAETRECPFCHAPPGVTCVRHDGAPVERFPAHPIREKTP